MTAMKLLIATDHCCLRHPTGVFDIHNFDRPFMEDYRQVFNTIRVICRMAKVADLPAHAFRSDGDGVQFLDVPDVHGVNWWLGARQLTRRAVRSAVAPADAVIVRVPSQLGWLAAIRARQLGKPCLAEVLGDPLQAIKGLGHGPHYRLAAYLEARRLQNLLRHASAVCFVSQSLCHQYQPFTNGQPCEVISDIRLDPSLITSARAYSAPLTRLKIALVAALHPYKRQADLIRACGQVRDQGLAVELHLAGNGPCLSSLRALCQKLHLDEQVVFHGHITDQKALYALLDQSDLFVMTSATEGMPRAMIEAMARGLPVAGSKTGGLQELVRASELFPVGDVRALASLIAALSRDPARLNEMSKCSLEKARGYTNDLLSARRIQLYQYLRDIAPSPHRGNPR
ncbi:MAG: hypothetical protein A2V67_02875 [Deltaproteobacteria bacterium RBG_13_61_14]|nr:MAG: hypothetical protein A2V67_02875 [Deltaproteobacteria bacterium RBG_13_61_14]